MVSDSKFTPFLQNLLDEGEKNPGSRVGQEERFQRIFYEHVNKVLIEVDHKLVAACRKHLSKQLADGALADEDRKEINDLNTLIDKSYKHGKVPFTVMADMVRTVFDDSDSDRAIDLIGGTLATVQSFVWPTSDDGLEQDPFTFELSDDARADITRDCVEQLYDPKQTLNICADADAAYIATCQLARAAEDARKEALGITRIGRTP